MFNTAFTYPEQDLDNDLCQAVVANGVVYLRGQIGQDLDTRESVGIGDVAAQADKAMALFPHARLVWFDHCGHFPHWDQPERTARLILEATEQG